MWSAVVVGTHPIEADQEVWLELSADDVALGPLPAYWIENKGVNSLWHVPDPPQAVGAGCHYRSAAHRGVRRRSTARHPDTMVRPNLPDRTSTSEIVSLVPRGAGRQPDDDRAGRREAARPMTSISRPSGSIPTCGRPRATCRRAGRTSARSWAGWRSAAGSTGSPSRSRGRSFQHYQGATNLLVTELTWRHGPIRVLVDRLRGDGRRTCPRTAGGTESPGQYLKRFRVTNEGPEPRGRFSACMSRPRSTAGSASRA